MTVLTLDLGTSATKALLWSGMRVRGMARVPLASTTHRRPGWSEQDASEWWGSVVAACRELRGLAPDDLDTVETIGFAAARESFVLVDEDLAPLGPGILWSDRRAASQVAALGEPEGFRARTGVIATAGAHAAKLAWLAEHDAEQLARARWVVAPRDLVVARLTGRVVTDVTLASRTGLCALDGGWLADARDRYGERLPDIRSSETVVGTITDAAAHELDIPQAARVVVGAGDRACEVLGAGAAPAVPMVSWGTTANLSLPHPGPPDALPRHAQVSRGALGAFVLEAGLSAAGGALTWLAGVTGRTPEALMTMAGGVEPGADGLLALPWLAGARAPWWRADAHAAFVGLTEAHGPPELARAIVEGVALDVARCADLLAPDAGELALAGVGAASDVWRRVLAAVTGRVLVRRAIDDAASVGARLVVARALGEALTVDDLNPVVGRESPEPDLVRAYRPVREASDAAAAAVLGLGG